MMHLLLPPTHTAAWHRIAHLALHAWPLCSHLALLCSQEDPRTYSAWCSCTAQPALMQYTCTQGTHATYQPTYAPACACACVCVCGRIRRPPSAPSGRHAFGESGTTSLARHAPPCKPARHVTRGPPWGPQLCHHQSAARCVRACYCATTRSLLALHNWLTRMPCQS